jgi:biotin carboxyl carrier protein
MKRLRITIEGKSYEVEVELLDEGFAVPTPRAVSGAGSARVLAPSAAPKVAAPVPVSAAGGGDGVMSPLAAVVVSIDVAIGARVEIGQTVVTLEAMKMNTIVSALTSGTVTAIHVAAGDAVEEGQVMVTLG